MYRDWSPTSSTVKSLRLSVSIFNQVLFWQDRSVSWSFSHRIFLSFGVGCGVLFVVQEGWSSGSGEEGEVTTVVSGSPLGPGGSSSLPVIRRETKRTRHPSNPNVGVSRNSPPQYDEVRTITVSSRWPLQPGRGTWPSSLRKGRVYLTTRLKVSCLLSRSFFVRSLNISFRNRLIILRVYSLDGLNYTVF